MIAHWIRQAWCFLFGHYVPVSETDSREWRQCVTCWEWVSMR